ncbi:MAG: hypothetical protein AAF656_04735 [Planctomycetota bacterium]
MRKQRWYILPVHIGFCCFGLFRILQATSTTTQVVGGVMLLFGTLGVVSFILSHLSAAGLNPPNHRRYRLYMRDHEFREVTDLTGFDVAWYDNLQRDLEREGFRVLGDVEDLDVEDVTGNRVVMRFMTGDDGTLVALAQHLPGGWRRLRDTPLRIVDLETELTADGDESKYLLVSTSNTDGLDAGGAAGIRLNRLPQDATLDDLLMTHRGEVDQCIDKFGLTPAPVVTLDDALAVQHRGNRLRGART